jgi:hypothetical protein
MRSARQPRLQSLEGPAVDNPIGRNAGQPGVRKSRLCVTQLGRRVRVAIDRKETSGRECPSGQRIVEVLTSSRRSSVSGRSSARTAAAALL